MKKGVSEIEQTYLGVSLGIRGLLFYKEQNLNEYISIIEAVYPIPMFTIVKRYCLDLQELLRPSGTT